MNTIQKKVCLLGDFAVGKTSLVRRFVEGRFDDRYLSTIGVKISRKTITRAEYILNLLVLCTSLALLVSTFLFGIWNKFEMSKAFAKYLLHPR